MGEGKKGKKLARMSLIPGEALFRLAEVYGIGEQKYASHNWRRGGIEFSALFDAMIRHAYQWLEGEEVDPDGQKHLASVAWMAFALLTLSETHPEDDDRPHVFLDTPPMLLRSEVTNPEDIAAAKEEATVGQASTPESCCAADEPCNCFAPEYEEGAPWPPAENFSLSAEQADELVRFLESSRPEGRGFNLLPRARWRKE
jgi:hypothetical protein